MQFAIPVQCYNSISLQVAASVEPSNYKTNLCTFLKYRQLVIFTMTEIKTRGPQSAA